MREPLKILILEDSATDAEIVKRLLIKEKLNCEFSLATNKETYLLALDQFQPDIILSDHSLPQFDSASALTIARQRFPDIPFIMVTGTVSEQFAADIIKSGADDYILKDRLARLPAAIDAAIKHRQAEKANREAERKIIQSEINLRAIFENTSEGFLLMDKDCIVKAFNKRSEEYAFFASEKRLRVGDNIYGVIAESRKDFFKSNISKVLKGETLQYERVHDMKNGKVRWIDFTITPVLEAGLINGICITGKDVTEKKIAEQQREFDNNNTRALINNTSDLMWSVDRDLRLITFNDSFNKVIEFTSGKPLVKGDYILSDQFTNDQIERYKKFYHRALSGETFTILDRFDHPFEFWVEVSYYPIRKEDDVIGVACFSRDITQRKKDEEEIKKSEEQYRDLVDNITDLICTHDLDGNILSVNRAAEELTGFKFDPGHLMNIKDLLIPDVKNKFDHYIEDIQRNGFVKGIMKVKSFSGNIHTWEFSNSLKTEGVITPIVRGYARDITESKKAERELKMSEERLKEAQSIAHISNWGIDLAQNVHTWSDEFYSIYGLNKADVQPSAELFLSLMHPEDADFAQKKVQEAFETFKNSSFNFRFIHKDGEIRHGYTEWRFEFDKKEKPIRLFGILQDITERKKAEKEITDYKYALDQSSIISMTDQKGIITYANENFCKISGYAQEELLEHDHQIINSGYHPKAYIKELWATIAKGKIWKGEFRNKAKDGSLYWVDATIIPFLNDKGKPVQYLAIRNDITEKKLIQQEIRDQKIQEQKKITRVIIKAQEKEKNRMGRELHDNVNQILASTKMYMGMVGKDKKTKEMIKYPMELIDSAINEIRALSHKNVTPQKNINLKELLELLLDEMNKNTSIKTTVVYDLKDEAIDDELKLNIYRIIQEQVNNILKHAFAKKVNLSVKAKNQTIHIVVTDDGKGFDVKKKRKGIGISNMINRVESFNGEITITSSPGNGCKTEINVPY